MTNSNSKEQEQIGIVKRLFDTIFDKSLDFFFGYTSIVPAHHHSKTKNIIIKSKRFKFSVNYQEDILPGHLKYHLPFNDRKSPIREVIMDRVTNVVSSLSKNCLLYTSDAADE